MSNRKVLVVDDSAIYRKIISSCLDGIDGIEVASTANNGKLALIKARSLKPDLITLDVEMPEMDGVETLRELQKLDLNIPIIMVSSHTKEGAAVTIEALELGAYHFVTKPAGMNLQKNMESLAKNFSELIAELPTAVRMPKVSPPPPMPKQRVVDEKVDVNLRTGELAAISLRPQRTPPGRAVEAPSCRQSERSAEPKRVSLSGALRKRADILAIGVSTGGPNALAEIIPRLPATLSVPVVIVQHMPADFTAVLAESLNRKSSLEVVEARGGMILKAGTVYVAPGGRQMKLVRNRDQIAIEVNDDPPVNHCKPAVDYLFMTVADLFGNKSLGLILTGMGSDGAVGCGAIKAKGGQVFVQSGESCVVNGMPKAALDAGHADRVIALQDIARELGDIL